MSYNISVRTYLLTDKRLFVQKYIFGEPQVVKDSMKDKMCLWSILKQRNHFSRFSRNIVHREQMKMNCTEYSSQLLKVNQSWDLQGSENIY